MFLADPAKRFCRGGPGAPKASAARRQAALSWTFSSRLSTPAGRWAGRIHRDSAHKLFTSAMLKAAIVAVYPRRRKGG
jgi:hypothetical protein